MSEDDAKHLDRFWRVTCVMSPVVTGLSYLVYRWVGFGDAIFNLLILAAAFGPFLAAADIGRDAKGVRSVAMLAGLLYLAASILLLTVIDLL